MPKIKAVKRHWKLKGVAACGERTGRFTIICDSVTCPKCRKLVADEWWRLIQSLKKD